MTIISWSKVLETHYKDGSVENKSVIWEDISDEKITKSGYFSINGVVDGVVKVSVNITMIDKISGVLNYSTTTPVGVKPELPTFRPAILADGTVLNTSFAVDWKNIDETAYNKIGNITVEGTTNVLGQEFMVTASIRVQEEKITIGNSISSAAKLSKI